MFEIEVCKMKLRLLIGILATLMLVTITYASAVTINTQNTIKESPLYKIRIKRSINEKINGILENIKTKFLIERIFFAPFQLLKNREYRTLLHTEAGTQCTFHGYVTCWPVCPK